MVHTAPLQTLSLRPCTSTVQYYMLRISISTEAKTKRPLPFRKMYMENVCAIGNHRHTGRYKTAYIGMRGGFREKLARKQLILS
jgi:hypothetical protein